LDDLKNIQLMDEAKNNGTNQIEGKPCSYIRLSSFLSIILSDLIQLVYSKKNDISGDDSPDWVLAFSD
jgi:hypothetical protein